MKINSNIVVDTKYKYLWTIEEVIKHRKFLVDDGDFQMVNRGNCYVIVDNGQIYIGEQTKQGGGMADDGE